MNGRSHVDDYERVLKPCVNPVISAETILWEEDNLQHVIWQLVMATNKVVLLYTIYATCAVSLIESRAYIAKELLLTATQLP